MHQNEIWFYLLIWHGKKPDSILCKLDSTLGKVEITFFLLPIDCNEQTLIIKSIFGIIRVAKDYLISKRGTCLLLSCSLQWQIIGSSKKCFNKNKKFKNKSFNNNKNGECAKLDFFLLFIVAYNRDVFQFIKSTFWVCM